VLTYANALRTLALDDKASWDAVTRPKESHEIRTGNSLPRRNLALGVGIGWVLGTEFATGFLPLPEEDVAVTRSFESHSVPTSRRMVVDVVRKSIQVSDIRSPKRSRKDGRLIAAIALMTTRSGAVEVSKAAGPYLLHPAHQAQMLLPCDCARSSTAHGLFTPPSCRTAFLRRPSPASPACPRW
jgi:hypothetical protein